MAEADLGNADRILAAYAEQAEAIEAAGGQLILMASRALPGMKAGRDDYAYVYRRLIDGAAEPVILHWLGDMFDPTLSGYWGCEGLEETNGFVLDLIAENPAKVDGIKILLLDQAHEEAFRARLPEGVRLYTGDDFRWGGCRHLPTASRCAMNVGCTAHSRGKDGNHDRKSIIGVDLAKNVFQLHGTAADGSVIFRKKLSRPQFHRFMARQPASLVVMEACGGAHYWARELNALGHQVKLISPHYVKPFVKRQKNDAADAEAIVEAALRPSMRFVEPKSEAQQASAVLFRFREKLVKQRTELINAIRSYLFEFGHIIPKGPRHLRRAAELVSDETMPLPDEVREICRGMLDEIGRKTERIDDALKQINAKSRQHETLKRLQTMPGLGPITAVAIETFAPPMETFRRGRDFAAWLGLVPRQNSTGGKQRLGRTSKMGQRDIRRLLIIGAMSVVNWASRGHDMNNAWLEAMLARKPRMVVAVALANKMARAIWAMSLKKESYRSPTMV